MDIFQTKPLKSNICQMTASVFDYLLLSTVWFIPFFRECPGEACRPLRAPEVPAPRAERCILGGERMWGAVLGEGEKRKRLLL